jgi:hypothetical protein
MEGGELRGFIDFNEKIDFSYFMCTVPFTIVDFIPGLRNIFVLRLDFPLAGLIYFSFLFHYCFLCHRHQIEFWPIFICLRLLDLRSSSRPPAAYVCFPIRIFSAGQEFASHAGPVPRSRI